MRKVQIKSIEDLTEDNLQLFEEGINEIQKKGKSKRALLESQATPHFSSVEQYMKYYDAISFEDFDKEFRRK